MTKNKIQNDIDNTGKREIIERALCIAGGAQNRISEVKECQRWHTKNIDPQVSDSTVDQLRLRIHHRENMSGERETKQENQKPGAEA